MLVSRSCYRECDSKFYNFCNKMYKKIRWMLDDLCHILQVMCVYIIRYLYFVRQRSVVFRNHVGIRVQVLNKIILTIKILRTLILYLSRERERESTLTTLKPSSWNFNVLNTLFRRHFFFTLMIFYLIQCSILKKPSPVIFILKKIIIKITNNPPALKN